MKETLNNILEYLILVTKLVDTRERKYAAVDKQLYDEASQLRAEELVILAELPKYTDFEAMKELLNKE